MPEFEQHLMELEKTHPSGAEEWVCPTCQRRFVVFWPPNYKKIILNPGDDYAFHSGGKGGIKLAAPDIESQLPDTSDSANKEEPELSDEWHSVFDELDFSDWPDVNDNLTS